MREILLTQGYITLVDDEDYAYLSQWKWRSHIIRKKEVVTAVYAARGVWDNTNKKYSVILLHRLLTKAPPGTEVDHKNHDGLNNQKSNLRVASVSQNRQNQRKQNLKKTSSRFKGVSWSKIHSRWVAYIKMNSKTTQIGYFKSEETAAKAYNKVALELFGEFACLNEITTPIS